MLNLNSKRWHIVFILGTGLVVNMMILYLLGERPDLYDVKGYVQGADHLTQLGAYESTHHIFYGLHIGIIALGRLVTPGEITLVIIFQILLSLLSVVVLYFSAYKLFQNKVAALFGCLFFLLWWDCIQWNTTLMSESLFCSLTIFIIYLLLHFQGRRKDFIKLGVTLLALCFTRPTSIVILVGVLAYFLFYYGHSLRQLSKIGQLFLLVLILSISLLGATLMFQKWDFTKAYVSGEVVTYMSTIQGSPLYHEELHTPLENAEEEQIKSGLGIVRIASFITNHPAYFFQMAFKKVYYLLSFQRPYYSGWHNAYSALWLVLVYASFIIGYLNCSHRPIKAFVLTIIIVNCMLIAMSTVDWDNRFFIPMEPGIVLFAGFGAYRILSLFRVPRETTVRLQ